MRVFAGSISTETNTFSPMPTGKQDYDIIWPQDWPDEKPREDGALDVLYKRSKEAGFDFFFGLSASAQPAGLTVKAVYEEFREVLLEQIKAAMPLDIVFLPLHGAMVAQGYDDCEEDIVHHVRQLVGADTVIAVELDLHCDISQQMVDESDLIVTFKEYPHVDMGTRASELFDLAVATARKQIKPKMALFDCRMFGMYLTPFEPMRSFVDSMKAAEGKDGILSLSLGHGFPWGDRPDSGTRMLAIADGDMAKAKAKAEEFGRRFFDMRKEVSLTPLSMQQALDKAVAADKGPIVIADQADNAGGGAPSDATFVLREILGRGLTDVALGMMWDPIAVKQAQAAGVGATLKLRLGGKMGPMSGNPLDLEVEVLGFIENMTQEWPQEDGAVKVPVGDSCALRCQGVDIIVNSKRCQVFSPQVFSNFGLEPEKKKILVVKSIQHFYAGFAPIAAEVLYMAAPGAVAPIMTDIQLENVDLHKYPWVENPFG